MADFPTYEKNAQRETLEVDITPPAFDPDDNRSAEERWIDQQWRDADAAGLGARHPLSLNRDSDHVTTDPYTT